MKIIPVHAFNPGPMTGDGNWTWLLPGGVPTLVDAGTGDPQHLAALDRALGGATLAQVLVTHAHTDHASGAAAVAALAPGMRFRKMPWPERDARWPVRWGPLSAGEAIEAGDTSLVALHTPGHAPDHLCFWHEESRSLFSGDLAVKGTTVWIPGSDEGDMGAYVASLERVLALGARRLYPAHGPVIDEPAGLLRGYIAHRLEREQQVLDALAEGMTTVETIAAAIYRGLAEALLPLARESVTAHLKKLQREQRALRHGDAWHIMDP